MTEYVTPIQKVPNPESEDQLRPISILPDLSRDYNAFLAKWILPYVQKRLDPAQFGAQKGNSITDYLVLLQNFIVSNTDTSPLNPNSILIALVDYSKGFSRISHNKILTRLCDWKTPGWLLRIIASYLTERHMIVRYKGAKSAPHPLPSGGPQGDILTIILFLVLVSDCGLDPPPPLPPNAVPGDVSAFVGKIPPIESKSEIRLKFFDDLSLGEVIRLKTDLVQMEDRTGPKTYHERNYVELLPANSKLQTRLWDLETYVKTNDMKINVSKSKIFPVNFTRKYDFLPKLQFENEDLEVTYTTKILGLVFSSNGEWDENIKYLTKKANARLYFLRRLKSLGASIMTLKEVYILFIRSIVEFCAPLWAGNLSKSSVKALDRIEQNAMKILFPGKTYFQSLEILQLKNLSQRRLDLTMKYGRKAATNPKMSHLFKSKRDISVATRSNEKYFEPVCRRNRHKYSTIPKILKLLNGKLEVFRN